MTARRRKRIQLDPFVWGALALLGFVLAGYWVGQSDQDADDLEYCQKVAAGAWPDYRQVYAALCNPPNPR